MKLNRLRNWKGISLMLGAVICLTLLTLCHSQTEEKRMRTRLTAIWYLLREEMLQGYRFPRSFSEMEPPGEPELFVCPRSGSVPGSWNSVDSWTDFIYVGGSPAVGSNRALVISPSENHGGGDGYVILEGGQFLRLPASEVAALIQDPFKWETNSGASVVQLMREEMVMSVPKRFRARYGKMAR